MSINNCRLSACLAFLAALALSAGSAHAQQQGLFSGNQGTGVGGAGANAQRAGGGSSFGTSGFSSGTFGSSGAGGIGGGTALPGAAASQLGQLSAQAGQGFIGRQDTAFVGADQANAGGVPAGGIRTGTGATAQFGQRGNNAFSNFGRQNGVQTQTGRTTGGETRRVVRPRQRIAFTYPVRTPTQVATNVRTQFRQVASRRPSLSGVSVQLNAQGVAVLSGVVESEDRQKLAAALARLEPGVRSVDNRIRVRTR